MHIKTFMNRVEAVKQLDIIGLDGTILQPRGKFFEQLRTEFVILHGSL